MSSEILQTPAQSVNAPPDAPARAPAPGKRPLIDNRLIKAAQRQAEQHGEFGEPEEHIDWTSASTIANAMKAQIKEGRKRGGAMPSDLRSELFGENGLAEHAQVNAPHAPQPLALPGALGKIEELLSKRVLMCVAAVSLVALIATLIGSNSVITSFEQGVTPDLPVPSFNIAPLSGVWLGLDRSQSAQGVPVMYVFTRPNWLIVTEPSTTAPTGTAGTPAVAAQANYTYSGGNLLLQPLPGANTTLLPSAASAVIKGNSVKITPPASDGAPPIVLQRPGAIVGNWQASGGVAKYSFANNGQLTITAPGEKPVVDRYLAAGGNLRVGESGSPATSPAAQTWQFTFDGGNLLLYTPDPANPSGGLNYGAPLRLGHIR